MTRKRSTRNKIAQSKATQMMPFNMSTEKSRQIEVGEKKLEGQFRALSFPTLTSKESFRKQKQRQNKLNEKIAADKRVAFKPGSKMFPNFWKRFLPQRHRKAYPPKRHQISGIRKRKLPWQRKPRPRPWVQPLDKWDAREKEWVKAKHGQEGAVPARNAPFMSRRSYVRTLVSTNTEPQRLAVVQMPKSGVANPHPKEIIQAYREQNEITHLKDFWRDRFDIAVTKNFSFKCMQNLCNTPSGLPESLQSQQERLELSERQERNRIVQEARKKRQWAREQNNMEVGISVSEDSNYHRKDDQGESIEMEDAIDCEAPQTTNGKKRRRRGKRGGQGGQAKKAKFEPDPFELTKQRASRNRKRALARKAVPKNALTVSEAAKMRMVKILAQRQRKLYFKEDTQPNRDGGDVKNNFQCPQYAFSGIPVARPQPGSGMLRNSEWRV